MINARYILYLYPWLPDLLITLILLELVVLLASITLAVILDIKEKIHGHYISVPWISSCINNWRRAFARLINPAKLERIWKWITQRLEH